LLLDPNDAGQHSSIRAWLALQRALHLDPQKAVELLRRTPDPAAVLRQAGLTRKLRDPSLAEAVEQLRRLGVRALPWVSDLYPDPLRVLPDAAPLLLVRGEPAVLLGRAVAVVGARAATVYGLDVARELAAALASVGVVVVSGLARGIDAAAHRAALAAGGLTVAFSACGPDLVYPAEHTGLASEIATSGAVVTEMPLGTPPLPHYFPLRNRLISGLAEVVVVVEARRRSGSLLTARRALDQGRDVMAVPGPINVPTSQGPNQLLRDGARAVCGVADLLDALGLVAQPVRPRRVETALGADSRVTLASLRAEPGTRDELAARLDLTPGDLAMALLELELAGLVSTDRDGRLRVLGGA
jgi:DNA processing protein